MPTPFPGMDPYLEQRSLWGEIHTNLIVEIQTFLAPLLRPKYRVAVEHNTYLSLVSTEEKFLGRPDVTIVQPKSPVAQPALLQAASGATIADPPMQGELPLAEEIIERHLEIRDATTQQVITAIEILSPTNKESRAGREQDERKRMKVLASPTNLVEIDLLRRGTPFPMQVNGTNGESHSDYRIIISRSWMRPKADIYLFNVRQPIPSFYIPLRQGEEEPVLPLNQILHRIYDSRGYDLAIDYSQPPQPPLSDEDTAWAAEVAG